ncbi:hypothetical protein BH11PSE8_BH11PSE8_16470 [soil metagenome]
MKTTLRPFVVSISLIAGAMLAAPVIAKLPPLSDEAKAKAAETASKSAWSDKVGAFKLCNVMNKVAAGYQASAKEAGKDVPTPIDTPPCTDPGAYAPVAAPAASAPPLEASGAHSPPATAVAPPSGKATEAENKGGAKK